MTLDSRVAIHDPIEPRKVFDFCNRLLKAPATIEWKQTPPDPASESDYERQGRIGNASGQGLNAWLYVYYGSEDGQTLQPRTRIPNEYGDYDSDPDSYIEVSFDTTYGFDVDGAHCSDLHAYLIHELGVWLSEQGIRWSWYNEFNGDWHFEETYGYLAEFGDVELGRHAMSVYDFERDSKKERILK